MVDNEIIRAGATILKDLSLFNQATVFYDEQISPVISAAVGQHIADWLELHRWIGETDVSDSFEDLWACPANWIENEEEPFARFHLQPREPRSTNSYEIADLFNVGQTNFGFRFVPEYSWFGGKSAWNASVKSLGDQIEPITLAGWTHEGKGILFRPIRLPVEHLVTAWENEDWTEVLAPLTLELDSLEENHNLFDRLIFKAGPKGA